MPSMALPVIVCLLIYTFTNPCSPWNEIECGDHYTRQMAGFALFEIASGMVRAYPGRIANLALAVGFFFLCCFLQQFYGGGRCPSSSSPYLLF